MNSGWRPNIYIYHYKSQYHTFLIPKSFWGLNSGFISQYGSTSGPFMRLHWGLQWEQSRVEIVISRVGWARGSISKMTHSHGLGRIPQLLTTWNSSKDHLSIPITWQLAFPKANDPREQCRSCFIFCGLALKSYAIIATMSYWLHWSALFSVGEQYNRAWKLGDGTHWESFQRLAMAVF